MALPSSGFTPTGTGTGVVSFPLPVPHRVRYFLENAAASPVTQYEAPGAAPRTVLFGEGSARTVSGLTAASEPTSYLEMEQSGVFTALMVDQFRLDRWGTSCDLELAIYAPDGSDLLVVGTSVFHDQPYLTLDRAYDATAVDFAGGVSKIGQFNAVVLDKRRDPADQRSGLVTRALADGGLDGLAGLRFDLRRWVGDPGGWSVLMSGVVHDVQLNSSAVSYTIALRDELEKANRKRAFTVSNSTILPGGPAVPFGASLLGGAGFPEYAVPINHTLWLYPAFLDGVVYKPADQDDAAKQVPAGTGVYVVDFQGLFTPRAVSDGGLGVNVVHEVPDWAVLTDELYAMGEFRPIGPTGNVMVDGEGVTRYEWEWELPMRLHWGRASDAWALRGDWTEPLHREVTWDPSPLLPSGTPQNLWDREYVVPPGELGTGYKLVRQAIKADDTVVQAIYGLPLELFGSDTPELSEAPGTEIKIALIWQGAPSEDYPLFIDRTAADFIKDVLDGKYGGLDEPMRYDAAAVAALPGHAFMMLTEPVDDLRSWMAKNAWAPLGMAPRLDTGGQLSPVSNAIPDVPADAAALTDADVQFAQGWDWSLGSPRVFNVMEFKYRRLYRDPAERFGVATQEVIISYRNEASIRRHGERPLKYDTLLFSSLGYAVNPGFLGGGPPGGSAAGLVNETGYLLAQARRLTIRDRYAQGTQGIKLYVRRSALPDFAAGDWLWPGVGWLPGLITGLRNPEAFGQAVSVSDRNCSWIAVELEANAREAPPPAPIDTLAVDSSFDPGTGPVYQADVSWTNTREDLAVQVWVGATLKATEPAGSVASTVDIGYCGVAATVTVRYVLPDGTQGRASAGTDVTLGCL